MKLLRAEQLAVGEEVYISCGRYQHRCEFGIVEGITPRGMIRVKTGDRNHRFNRYGQEIGDNPMSRPRRSLIDGKQGHAWVKLLQARAIAAQRLQEIVRVEPAKPTWGCESLQEQANQIANKLTEAKEAIELAKIAEGEFQEAGGYDRI